MPDALETVKALAADTRRLALKYEVDGDTSRARIQTQRSDALEAVAHELESARKRLRPISTDFGDLSDLPEEVMQQLNLTKVDELEQQLRDIVASGNGAEVGIDPIIIELWRRHRITKSRTYIMNKLYRMAQKGSISSVDGKKGVYCVPKPCSENSSANFGELTDDLDEDIPF